MNKMEAVAVMVKKVEEIERERIAAHLSIEPNQQKKEVVDRIYKALKGVEIENEDNQDNV